MRQTALDLGPDVVDAVLFDRGQPIGAMVLPEEELPRIGDAIRRSVGYAYRPARQVGHRIYDLEAGGDGTDDTARAQLAQACTEELPRGCELAVGLGRVLEIAQAIGTQASEIETLEARGEATEREAQDAMRTAIERMPCGSDRAEAEIWYAELAKSPAAAVGWDELVSACGGDGR